MSIPLMCLWKVAVRNANAGLSFRALATAHPAGVDEGPAFARVFPCL